MAVTKTKQDYKEVIEEHSGKDQYYSTPVSLIKAQLKPLYDDYKPFPRPRILDVGSGNLGGYGYVARQFWPDAYIVGVDVRPVPAYPWYNHMVFDDATSYEFYGQYDFIIGNPAFRLAEAKVRHLHNYMHHDSVLSFLVRANFTESKTRGQGFWKEYPFSIVRFSDRRPTWWLYETSNVGKMSTNNVAYNIFEWSGLVAFDSYATFLAWDYELELEKGFIETLAKEGKKLNPKALENIERLVKRQERRNGKANRV